VVLTEEVQESSKPGDGDVLRIVLVIDVIPGLPAHIDSGIQVSFTPPTLWCVMCDIVNQFLFWVRGSEAHRAEFATYHQGRSKYVRGKHRGVYPR